MAMTTNSSIRVKALRAFASLPPRWVEDLKAGGERIQRLTNHLMGA